MFVQQVDTMSLRGCTFLKLQFQSLKFHASPTTTKEAERCDEKVIDQSEVKKERLRRRSGIKGIHLSRWQSFLVSRGRQLTCRCRMPGNGK